MYPFRAINHPSSDIQHPTILLHTSQGKRYLFGKVPEGLQRSLNEQKLRVSKLGGIFLTGQLDWESMGGLPGMILTVSDQGKKDLNIYHGSNVIEYIVSTWRYFVFRFGMDLRAKVIPHGTTHKDEIMDVRTIQLKRSTDQADQPFSTKLSEQLKHIISKMFPLDVQNDIPLDSDENGDYTGYDTEDEGKVSQEKAQPAVLHDPHVHIRLPDFQNSSTSTCYAINLHSVRGKFNAKAAIELSVTPGPTFAKLAAGNEVVLPNGDIVKPSQVMSAQRVFETVLMVDVPSKDYIPAAKDADWGQKVGVIYHFLGRDIDPFEGDYMEFIESFGPECTHYISHPDYCPNSLTYKGAANVVLKLKTLQPNQFNLPETHEAKKTMPSHISQNIHILLQGQVFEIEATDAEQRNKIRFDDSFINVKTSKDWASLYDSEVVPLNLEMSRTKEQIIHDQTTVSTPAVTLDKPLKDQVEIITFGTGSALPSKYRNVISNLVRIPYKDGSKVGYRSILLDAGENTIGTMRRTLRVEQLEKYFKELQVIYLSHLHADHHLGIVTIIKEWLKFNSDNGKPLYLVSPWQYTHFVKEWMNVEGDIAGLERIVHISCEDLLPGKKRLQIEQTPWDDFDPSVTRPAKYVERERDTETIKRMYLDAGIKKFSTCRAYHCSWAYCCSITYQLDGENEADEFKVSYSGDTRPNLRKFAEKIGKGTDLLIHEATMENDLLEEAKKKKHCTINEAINVSNEMEAKKLILTHFSQRYPKLPHISNNTVVNADYCFAFDSMIVKYDQIGEQMKVFDQLNLAFASEEEEEKKSGGGVENGE